MNIIEVKDPQGNFESSSEAELVRAQKGERNPFLEEEKLYKTFF